MHFRENILIYTIVPLLILLSAASYYRFVIQKDYLVSYEGDCDPYTETCFLYCEDDECTEPFYYSIIERKASEVFALCGTDVTLCDEAYECQENVETCSVTYCDIEFDGKECEVLTEKDFTEDFNDIEI